MNNLQQKPTQPPKGLLASQAPANELNFRRADITDAANDPKPDESLSADDASQGLKNASDALGDQNKQPHPDALESSKNNGGRNASNTAQSSSVESKWVNIPPNLQTSEQVLEAVRLLLDAPVDMPDRADAVRGLWLVLKSLELEFPDVEFLIQAIEKVGVRKAQPVVAMQSVLGLSRRKGLHRIYALSREIGHAHFAGKVHESTLLRIFGCHCIRSLLSGYQPSAGSLAKLRKALLFEANKMSSWQPAARSRALISAKKGVEAAVQGNPLAASWYGLSVIVSKPKRELSPVELFNNAFRRRTENLVDFSTRDAVAAAGGYDTLSAAGLLHSGNQLLGRIETRDPSALVVALETITHLPSETLLQIPIVRRGASPCTALAWIEIDLGEYCYVLYRLIEKGAKVPPGKEHLYEKATQIVRKKLSPPILRLLQTLDRAGGQAATNLEGITGADSVHHSRSAVVEGTGYRVTARRLQESLPALMLQEGLHRWPVALSTNSHFLLTRGRRQYGACRPEEVHKVVCRECSLLGWPEPDAPLETRLVGAPTVPTSAAVTQCLNFLSVNADKHSGIWISCDMVIQGLNAHAQWISGLAALSLALRMWLVYQIQLDSHLPGSCAHFNDKDLHEFDGPGVPVVTLLRDSLGAWTGMCRDAIQSLKEFGDARSIALADQITVRLHDDRFLSVFQVDAVDRIQPAGYKTWHDVLPINIRLQPNFSRQFWPLKLTDHGVVQLTMDILMRHQFEGFSPGSTHSSHKLASTMRMLLKAMNATIYGLGLQVPMMFRGTVNGT